MRLLKVGEEVRFHPAYTRNEPRLRVLYIERDKDTQTLGVLVHLEDYLNAPGEVCGVLHTTADEETDAPVAMLTAVNRRCKDFEGRYRVRLTDHFDGQVWIASYDGIPYLQAEETGSRVGDGQAREAAPLTQEFERRGISPSDPTALPSQYSFDIVLTDIDVPIKAKLTADISNYPHTRLDVYVQCDHEGVDAQDLGRKIFEALKARLVNEHDVPADQIKLGSVSVKET